MITDSKAEKTKIKAKTLKSDSQVAQSVDFITKPIIEEQIN
jgi:hypothetical protein